MELNICHLYPDVLNLYGDGGNIICMRRRLAWRGIDCHVSSINVGDSGSLAGYDLVFIGGGQDFEQEVLLPDLQRGRANEVKSAIQDGVTFLTICGGYQMLGNYYETYTGERCDFIGAVDFYTVGAEDRMIGNYIFTCTPEAGGSEVVAFENHSGRTYLGDGVQPLGTVKIGNGNNGADGTEGIHFKNVFGTYGHGSLLPKNPELADFILRTALERKYGACTLEPLDDSVELSAHKEIAVRLYAQAK